MSDLVKILIRVPRTAEEVASVFPLIHQLKTEYPVSQVHIIHSEGLGEYYEILPFDDIYTYEFNEDEKSVPAIHKFAVNLNEVFNIDYYFDLVGDFKSSFLGFSFKAKERIGYVSGLNKILLTHKVEPLNSYRPDRVHLNLLESFLNKKFSETKVCGKDKVESLKSNNEQELANLPNYFLIDSDELMTNREFWDDFFRFFENQYFVIWFEPSKGQEEYNLLVEHFKGLEQKNIYLVKTGPIDLFYKLLAHSIGYISEKLRWAYITTYLGIQTYSLVKRATDLPFMEHYERSPILIEMKDGLPTKWIGSEENESMETVDSFVNRLHDIHKL